MNYQVLSEKISPKLVCSIGTYMYVLNQTWHQNAGLRCMFVKSLIWRCRVLWPVSIMAFLDFYNVDFLHIAQPVKTAFPFGRLQQLWGYWYSSFPISAVFFSLSYKTGLQIYLGGGVKSDQRLSPSGNFNCATDEATMTSWKSGFILS